MHSADALNYSSIQGNSKSGRDGHFKFPSPFSNSNPQSLAPESMEPSCVAPLDFSRISLEAPIPDTIVPAPASRAPTLAFPDDDNMGELLGAISLPIPIPVSKQVPVHAQKAEPTHLQNPAPHATSGLPEPTPTECPPNVLTSINPWPSAVYSTSDLLTQEVRATPVTPRNLPSSTCTFAETVHMPSQPAAYSVFGSHPNVDLSPPTLLTSTDLFMAPGPASAGPTDPIPVTSAATPARDVSPANLSPRQSPRQGHDPALPSQLDTALSNQHAATRTQEFHTPAPASEQQSGEYTAECLLKDILLSKARYLIDQQRATSASPPLSPRIATPPPYLATTPASSTEPQTLPSTPYGTPAAVGSLFEFLALPDAQEPYTAETKPCPRLPLSLVPPLPLSTLASPSASLLLTGGTTSPHSPPPAQSPTLSRSPSSPTSDTASSPQLPDLGIAFQSYSRTPFDFNATAASALGTKRCRDGLPPAEPCTTSYGAPRVKRLSVQEPGS